MHIHGNSMHINPASFNSASLQDRAAAAQRAAETRKRLLKAAQLDAADAADEESLLVGRWLHTQAIPLHGGDPDREDPPDEVKDLF